MSESASKYLADWKDFSKHQASAISLLAANAMPLLGVLFWGWSTFAIVLIYWAENVVIGLINVLKMLFCNASADEVGEDPMPHAAKFFFVPFFTVHYGIFCLVHGVFVFVLLGGDDGGLGGPLGDWDQRFAMIRETGALWGILALTVSHLFSFVRNYLLGGESRRTTLPQLMSQPYGRIVVLHLAILFGAFATMALGSPIWLLMILIVGKTALDLNMHLREHRSASQTQSDDGHDRQNRGNEGFGAGT